MEMRCYTEPETYQGKKSSDGMDDKNGGKSSASVPRQAELIVFICAEEAIGVIADLDLAALGRRACAKYAVVDALEARERDGTNDGRRQCAQQEQDKRDKEEDGQRSGRSQHVGEVLLTAAMSRFRFRRLLSGSLETAPSGGLAVVEGLPRRHLCM